MLAAEEEPGRPPCATDNVLGIKTDAADVDASVNSLDARLTSIPIFWSWLPSVVSG